MAIMGNFNAITVFLLASTVISLRLLRVQLVRSIGYVAGCADSVALVVGYVVIMEPEWLACSLGCTRSAGWCCEAGFIQMKGALIGMHVGPETLPCKCVATLQVGSCCQRLGTS